MKAIQEADRLAKEYADKLGVDKIKLSRAITYVIKSKNIKMSALNIGILIEMIASAQTDQTAAATNSYKFNPGDAMTWHDKVANGDGQEERCSICGRKVGENPAYVEVHNGGDLVEYGKGIHDGGYMGAWAIGSECAKQFNPALLGSIN